MRKYLGSRARDYVDYQMHDPKRKSYKLVSSKVKVLPWKGWNEEDEKTSYRLREKFSYHILTNDYIANT